MASVNELIEETNGFNNDFLKLFTDFQSPYDVHIEDFGTIKGTLTRCTRLWNRGFLIKQKIDGRIKFKWTGKEYESRYGENVSNYNEMRLAHANEINNEFLQLFTEWTWPKSIKDEKYGAVLERCYRLEEEGCLIKKKVNGTALFKWTGKEYFRKAPHGRQLKNIEKDKNNKFESTEKYWAEKYKEQQRFISAERRGVRMNNYVSGSTLHMAV